MYSAQGIVTWKKFMSCACVVCVLFKTVDVKKIAVFIARLFALVEMLEIKFNKVILKSTCVIP